MSLLTEFREFVNRGNVMDLAVGVIIGGAFGNIVQSLVEDLIMPAITKLVGGIDYSNMFIPLNGGMYATLSEARKAGPVLAYGNFATVLLNFLLLAFCVFLLIKGVNQLRKPVPHAPPQLPADVAILTEIRDLLKK